MDVRWHTPAWDDEKYSDAIDTSQFDTHGLVQSLRARKHQNEDLANEGTRQARRDWLKYVGDLDDEPGGGGCVNGHFAALTLPTCKPERLRIIAYIYECGCSQAAYVQPGQQKHHNLLSANYYHSDAFIYDKVVEATTKASLSDDFLSDIQSTQSKAKSGQQQLQSKMTLELLSLDRACAEDFIEEWKVMLRTTTKRDKQQMFTCVEEYINYRILDAGAKFVDKMMLFGMGLRLTQEERLRVESVVRPGYIAFCLANDYFSFDVEYEDFMSSAQPSITNIVWLFMTWRGVGIAEAKRLVRDIILGYERDFKALWEELLSTGQASDAQQRYLTGMSFQVVGNVLWSLDCPRYHPLNRTGDLPWSDNYANKATSTYHGNGNVTRLVQEPSWEIKSHESRIAAKYALAPYRYVDSLSSGGIWEHLIDALLVWLPCPEGLVTIIKSIVRLLHSAFLMQDDIKNASAHRRDKPATHTVFGTAQTINSSGYLIALAMEEARKLKHQACLGYLIEELQSLYIGRSVGLYWSCSGKCLSEEDYLGMVEKKTGGILRLIIRLLRAESSALPECKVSLGSMPCSTHLDRLIILFSQYSRIREDYKSLHDRDYDDSRGFCDEVDEGRLSFPMTHALSRASTDSEAARIELRSILFHSSKEGNANLSCGFGNIVLNHLKRCGSLSYTYSTLQRMQYLAEEEITEIERCIGITNWTLRLLLFRLKV